MTKDEIATRVADEARLTKAQAEAAYQSLINVIAGELMAGRDFLIRDIGTLKVQSMAARTGRNPRSGEQIQIPARKAVKFHSAPSINRKIND